MDERAELDPCEVSHDVILLVRQAKWREEHEDSFCLPTTLSIIDYLATTFVALPQTYRRTLLCRH